MSPALISVSYLNFWHKGKLTSEKYYISNRKTLKTGPTLDLKLQTQDFGPIVRRKAWIYSCESNSFVQYFSFYKIRVRIYGLTGI